MFRFRPWLRPWHRNICIINTVNGFATLDAPQNTLSIICDRPAFGRKLTIVAFIAVTTWRTCIGSHVVSVKLNLAASVSISAAITAFSASAGRIACQKATAFSQQQTANQTAAAYLSGPPPGQPATATAPLGDNNYFYIQTWNWTAVGLSSKYTRMHDEIAY